jgi:4-carboxymuconolactone decarboxylase
MPLIPRPSRARLAPLPTGPNGTNVSGLLAYAAGVGRAYQALGESFGECAVAPRDRELIILRTAWRTGNRYAFARHRVHGEAAGLTEREITDAARPWAQWDADFEPLIKAVDEICADDCLSEAAWQALLSCRSAEEVVQIILLIGYHRQLSGLLNSIGVELESGFHGWD